MQSQDDASEQNIVKEAKPESLVDREDLREGKAPFDRDLKPSSICRLHKGFQT
jgi:hypothetical protein